MASTSTVNSGFSMSNNSNSNNSNNSHHLIQQAISGSSREYCLRWNNHQPNLVTFFGTLYSNESLVDVTLVSAEGKKIQAHKLVLSACSPYFQNAFESNPCKHPIVILKDVEFVDLQAIVRFIYNGEVNISQERINSILKTANSLQVKGLAEVPAEELKRVSSGVGDSSPPASQRTVQDPTLISSASWSQGDSFESTNDIPRKKLKKSMSATASYAAGSTNLNTNGTHSASIDSGVGASVSRSIDESGPTEEVMVIQKRTSLPGPPPLLPKSRSLDHNLHRGDSHLDSEMSSRQPEHHHSYDEGSTHVDRGYEIDEVKIEEVSDEGGIEYLEEDEEEYDEDLYENFASADLEVNGSVEPKHTSQSQSKYLNNNKPAKSQTKTQTPSTVPKYRDRQQPLRISSAAGEKRRRGRPLLRQPRIKRSDNDPSPGGGREQLGSEVFSGGESLNRREDSESKESNGHSSSSQNGEGRSSPYMVEVGSRYSSIYKSNLPIVRVSQCSPTPPSSPTVDPLSPSATTSIDEHQPVIVSTITFPSSTSAYESKVICSSPLLLSASCPQVTTLLTVPSAIQSITSTTSSMSSSSGSHLVKQISQPLLPSHTLVPFGGITTGNPVIRRQYSSPSTSQQTRIIQSVKQGGVVQRFSSESFLHEPEEERSISIIDMHSSADPEKLSISHFGGKRQLKKDGSREENFASGNLSIDESTNQAGGSFDEGLPVNRSGHCPALRPGPALGCNFCWNSVDNVGRILRRKTKYHCPECHINLCIVPCFQEYHEKVDKKKKPRSKLGLPKPSSM